MQMHCPKRATPWPPKADYARGSSSHSQGLNDRSCMALVPFCSFSPISELDNTNVDVSFALHCIGLQDHSLASKGCLCLRVWVWVNPNLSSFLFLLCRTTPWPPKAACACGMPAHPHGHSMSVSAKDPPPAVPSPHPHHPTSS